MQRAASVLQQSTECTWESEALVWSNYPVCAGKREDRGTGRNRSVSAEHGAGGHLAINSLNTGTYIGQERRQEKTGKPVRGNRFPHRADNSVLESQEI